MALMQEFNTPMMKQYLELKKKYHDCLLFFRLGDFYELFMEDAKIGAKILGITLTARSRGSDGRIPMAGVPFHAVDNYLPKLVKAGYKVAICEQLGDPSKQELVEREVVRIVTVGSLISDNNLNEKEHNYTITFSLHHDEVGLAICDLSTGEMLVDYKKTHHLEIFILDLLYKLKPSECILPSKLYNDAHFLAILKKQEKLNIFHFQSPTDLKDNEIVKNHFKLKNFYSLGSNNHPLVIACIARIINYFQQTQLNKLIHIQEIKDLTSDNYMLLDHATVTNLEILQTLQNEKRGSLLNFLDQTETAMGAREMKTLILNPLLKKQALNARLEALEELILEQENLHELIKKNLDNIADLERISSKLSLGLENPRDLIALKISLENCLELRNILEKFQSPLLKEITEKIPQEISSLCQKIAEIVEDDPPVDPKIGGLIKVGVNKNLDLLKNHYQENKKWLLQYEKKLQEELGLSSLKVKYNKIFGFFVEVGKVQSKKIPAHFERKQTLVNSERYTTDILQKQEQQILANEEETSELEFKIYQFLREKILTELSKIKQTSQAIALFDCLLSLAKVCLKNHFVKPEINDIGLIDIKNARHPVVEDLLKNEQFIPNDIFLDQDDHQLLIITGPNMAGKSVYIRQTALIMLLFHLGMFLPASSANVCLLDRIFVRSGASDAISHGMSTFMLEMTETAYILKNATRNSLIVMDEIGRGTSTYDGISIAWAIAEYLATTKHKAAKTLFATHYHELQQLEKLFKDKIKNYAMQVYRDDKDLIFLYKMKQGASPHSFGNSVAKLAGVPEPIIERAKQILENLESKQTEQEDYKIKLSKPKPEKNQFADQERKILDELKIVKIEEMSPLSSLNYLAKIKESLNQK